MARLMAGAGPPWEPAADAAVLGAKLLTRPAIHEAAVLLRPDDFHDPLNRRIYEGLRRVFERGDPVDPYVAARLRGGDEESQRPWKQALARRLAACGAGQAIGGLRRWPRCCSRRPTPAATSPAGPSSPRRAREGGRGDLRRWPEADHVVHPL